MRPDLVAIVESVYDLEQDTSSWIDGMLRRLEALLDDDVGLFGFTYRVSEAGALIPESFGMRRCTPEMVSELPLAVTQVGPDFVRQTYLDTDAGVATEFEGWRPSVAAESARRSNVEDVWSINGRNWRNRGCALFGNRRHPGAPPAKVRGLFTRLAAHLAAAQRLRCRGGLGTEDPAVEAILAPDGKVQHAVGIARARGALDALRAGSVSMDRARGRLRKSDPERALGTWKGLVAARWTLVDHFESDGRRYILARENEPDPCSHAALSPRERQVLANAALGRSNKEIAYALGLAHSTVRVLLARAAKKLRAPTRAELVRRFEALGGEGARRPPGVD